MHRSLSIYQEENWDTIDASGPIPFQAGMQSTSMIACITLNTDLSHESIP